MGVDVSDCTVTGGDQGLVFKECTSCEADSMTITAGSANGVLFKAGTSCSITNSTITGTVGDLVRVDLNGANKSSLVTFTGNTVTATGSADIFYWIDATGDDGGSICDSNAYDISGTTGNIGDVYGTADIKTLAALQAAWSTYDVTTNDANSTVTT